MSEFRFSIRKYLSVRHHLWRAKRLLAKAKNALGTPIADKFMKEADKHMDKAEEILKSLKQ